MANERLIDLAVVALAARIRSALPTYLRAVEAEQSMAASSLADPAAVIESDDPFDARSPLVEVFDVSADAESIALGSSYWQVTCAVAVTYQSDATSGAGEKFIRRYATALIRMLLADPTLGGYVSQAAPSSYASDVTRGEDSHVRHAFILTVLVDLQDT